MIFAMSDNSCYQREIRNKLFFVNISTFVKYWYASVLFLLIDEQNSSLAHQKFELEKIDEFIGYFCQK